jgi:two-component system OmpR family sensor kinase
LKKYVKESFLKTFGIFFLSLFILTSLLTFFYFKEQKHLLQESIFTQMKDFTYDFDSKRFYVDIVPKDDAYDELNLQPCDGGMCGYFTIPNSTTSLFKVFVPQKKFDEALSSVLWKITGLYLFLLVIIFIFSILSSIYALYPLKKALTVLEEFVKDMVHDLHTPITSILLNVHIIKKHHTIPELEHIELGAKSIASLYQNLQAMQHGFIRTNTSIELSAFLRKSALPFQKLYPKLTFVFDVMPYNIISDEHALCRIIDNIIANACKYNTKNGTVMLTNCNNKIEIKDTGEGIKNCNRVFERYYKESERGLGIGLNIVKNLCDALGIRIQLQSHIGQGTTVELVLPIQEIE